MKNFILFLVKMFLKPSAEKIVDQIMPLIKKAIVEEAKNNKSKRYTYYPADMEKLAETVAKKVSAEVAQKAHDTIFNQLNKIA